MIPSYIPLNKSNLDTFFAEANQQLTAFNKDVITLVEQLAAYLNNSFPKKKSSEFLKFVANVKKMCGVASMFKEESKEDCDFDWLFKGKYGSEVNVLPQIDAKLIDIENEWTVI